MWESNRLILSQKHYKTAIICSNAILSSSDGEHVTKKRSVKKVTEYSLRKA